MRINLTLAALALVACSRVAPESPDYESAPGDGGAPDPSPDPSPAPPRGNEDAGAPVATSDASPADARAHDAPADVGPDRATGCPVLTFPSGIRIKTFKDSVMTDTYKNHLQFGDTAPECFIDTNNLLDPDLGVTYGPSVLVAQNFQLSELVATELSGGYGHLVLVSPAAVVSLEKLREAIDGPLAIVDGFRSPKHQEDVCRSICGNPLGCTGSCGNNSRHMFGDGFDLPLELHDPADEQRVCSAGFKSMSVEVNARLHVDQNPRDAVCVPQ